MTADGVPYTVTYLSMPRPFPRTRLAAPAGPALALMRTPRPTVRFFRYLYGAVGAGEQVEWFGYSTRSDADLEALLGDPEVALFTLLVDGEPGGFHLLDFREPGICDLMLFGLTPEARGRRIAPWLLQEALGVAAQREVETATVDTCSYDHPSALGLYQRAGFAPVRREQRLRAAA